MTILTLIRTLTNSEATFGVLLNDKQNFICHMLELPWKENQHNISCIPGGTYECVYITHGDTFRYLVKDVPNRDNIQIHVGNKPSDILGCLAPGMEFARIEDPFIMRSGVAMDRIKSAAPKNNFMLKIEWIG